MTTALSPLARLETSTEFVARHIGPYADDEAQMLSVIGAASREALISTIVPASIRRPAPMDMPPAVGEAAALLGALPAGPALVYLDPPFRQDLIAWLALGASLQPQRLILEHPTTLSTPREAGALVLDRRRTYGGVALALYEAPPRAALG